MSTIVKLETKRQTAERNVLCPGCDCVVPVRDLAMKPPCPHCGQILLRRPPRPDFQHRGGLG